GRAKTAGVAGVAVSQLVLPLVAGEGNLLRVDDDDEVTGVNVRSEDRLVLTAKQRRSLRGKPAEDDVLRVDDMPAALHIAGLRAVGAHGSRPSLCSWLPRGLRSRRGVADMRAMRTRPGVTPAGRADRHDDHPEYLGTRRSVKVAPPRWLARRKTAIHPTAAPLPSAGQRQPRPGRTGSAVGSPRSSRANRVPPATAAGIVTIATTGIRQRRYAGTPKLSASRRRRRSSRRRPSRSYPRADNGVSVSCNDIIQPPPTAVVTATASVPATGTSPNTTASSATPTDVRIGRSISMGVPGAGSEFGSGGPPSVSSARELI